jgi:4-hydroxy-tetrahydrodipicolinate synthase
MCRTAERMGADMCLITPPYYNRTTQHGLLEHFGVLAASTSLPIMMYNIPSRCGMNMEPSTVAELFKIPNITAIKEASANI